MAIRDEKQVRLELPSTSSVECEIRESLGREEYVLTFYQNERQLKSCTISQSHLNQDNMVDLLSDAGVEFFSFSAIFDVADLLLTTIKGEFQELPMGQQSVVKDSDLKPTIEEPIEEFKEIDIEPDISADEIIEEEPKEVLLEKKPLIERGDKLLSHFEMPYSQDGFAGVYFCPDGEYAVVLFENENALSRKKFLKETVKQDNLVNMISEAGIEFLSFSAIYDTAERIENIILHPEKYIQVDKKEEAVISETGYSEILEKDIITPSEPEIIEDEMVMLDLSAFDASKYTKADDFDEFLEKLTEFVSEGQPLPVKEMTIEKSGGVKCIILQRMNNWFLRYKYKDGTSSDVEKVELNQDEIAKSINKNIPQISFSYLYDASEMIHLAIEQLAKRSMDEVILNVAIGHFIQVIEQYEEEGDLKSAAKVTEVLFERSRKEKNAKGLLQFGNKLLQNLAEQKKSTKVTKLQTELAEELIDLEPVSAFTFILDSSELLAEQEKFLNAANLCGLLLDHYLSQEKKIEDLSNILLLAKKQIDFYKNARLPVVMWENALRYAHYAIQSIGQTGPETISFDNRTAYQEDINFLLDLVFEIQEERKSFFELLESLQATMKLFKEISDKVNYSKYIDRLVLTAETQNKKELALDTALEASKYLMDSQHYRKACEIGNQAIKYFYEFNKIDSAVDFSLNVVRGLVDLNEAEAAKDYLKFVEDLINRAYADNETTRIEKQLTLGDLFGKLGDRDHGKNYIQRALQSIQDPNKRKGIILKYVDDLLVNKAVLTAQEMANLELARLLKENRIDEVIRFCQSFIDKLKEHNEHNMAFEYIRYISNLMLQTDYTDYDLLLGFIKDLLRLNAIDHAGFMIDQLVTIQNKHEDFTRAIDALNRFIEHLLEKTDRYDLVQKYVNLAAENYRLMGDPDGALERLIAFQKDILSYSVDLAQKITDEVLRELERKDDLKTATDIVSGMIEKQMEQERFQDAYIFSVQNARYLESMGDIEEVIKYLEKVRNKFIEHEQFEDAGRMTDLIVRFGRSHNRYKLVINAVKDFSKLCLERGDLENSVKFSLESASLLIADNKEDKALEYLQMVFNNTYSVNKQAAIKVFQRILEIRADRDDFKKIAKKYLEPLLEKYPDLELIKKVGLVLKPPFEQFSELQVKIYSGMFKSDQVTEEVAEAIVDLVNLTYSKELTKEGDRLADKFTPLLLDAEYTTAVSRLMASVLEKTDRPISEILPISFDFIKSLINRSLIEGAREFADRVVEMVSTDHKYGLNSRLLAAKITEKFAIKVAVENPDLASEYAYQASDLYRSLNDYEGMVSVYTNLANQYSSPSRAIRAYQRGISVFKKFKAKKYELRLLIDLTQFLISVKNSTALSYFQQTLEKLEEMENLEELLNVAITLIETAIEADNLRIAHTYLDYLCRLSSMIDASQKVGGILTFLYNRAKKTNDAENLTQVQKYLKELNIQPKKYKKAYTSLLERQKVKIGEMEAIELEEELELVEEEPEAVPELVDTHELIPPPISPPLEAPEIVEDFHEKSIEEEVVSVIKAIEQEQIPKPSQELIPDLTTLIEPVEEDKTKTVEEIDQITLEKEIEELPPLEEDIGEIPPLESHIERSKTSLTDEEISSLFAMKPPSSRTPTPTEIDESLEESISEPIEPKQPGLTEEEVQDLFSPSLETMQESIDQAELVEVTEEHWEVDAFGRLWRKGSLPSKEEPKQPELQVEEPPPIPETPDLTPLEAIIREEEAARDRAVTVEPPSVLSVPQQEIVEEKSELGVLEKALAETQAIVEKQKKPEIISEQDVFSEETPSPITSVVDALLEDEKSTEADIFGVPEVAYQEITPKEKPEEDQEPLVQPPNLADLFSDALSELSSISGETGVSKKKEEKKK